MINIPAGAGHNSQDSELRLRIANNAIRLIYRTSSLLAPTHIFLR